MPAWVVGRWVTLRERTLSAWVYHWLKTAVSSLWIECAVVTIQLPKIPAADNKQREVIAKNGIISYTNHYDVMLLYTHSGLGETFGGTQKVQYCAVKTTSYVPRVFGLRR